MEPVMKSASLRRTSALAARPTACLAVLSLAFALLYVVSNRLASGRSDVGAVVFAWEHAIPFVEWTIVPYVSICAFFALSFLMTPAVTVPWCTLESTFPYDSGLPPRDCQRP